MSGSHGPKTRGRVWDPLVRLFHWSLAAAFATAWFERSEAAIHETAGKIVLVLIIVRAAWGLVGTASARFDSFIKGPLATVRYVWSILRGSPAHHLGHNPAGAAMIGALLLSLTVTTASGILMTTAALWGNGWIEWIHGTAATLSVWLIAGHLVGVLAACIQHRENLPLAMISGRKWVTEGTKPYLGGSRFSARRLAAVFTLIFFSAIAWGGSESVLNASIWRMEKIVAAEVGKHGCEVAGIQGPRLELYPEIKLRYDVAIGGREAKAEAVIAAALAMQPRPRIDLSAFAPLCAPNALGIDPEAAVRNLMVPRRPGIDRPDRHATAHSTKLALADLGDRQSPRDSRRNEMKIASGPVATSAMLPPDDLQTFSKPGAKIGPPTAPRTIKVKPAIAKNPVLKKEQKRKRKGRRGNSGRGGGD
jgi:cytochrome b